MAMNVARPTDAKQTAAPATVGPTSDESGTVALSYLTANVHNDSAPHLTRQLLGSTLR